MLGARERLHGVCLADVEFGGAGPPILLLHGLMGRPTTWWSVASRLAEHVRMAYDARGHGGRRRADQMMNDAANVLQQLDVGPAVRDRMIRPAP